MEEVRAQVESGGDMSEVAEAAKSAPAWARKFVALAQRRVSEVESELSRTREDVRKLRGRAEAIIAENDELRVRLAEQVSPAPREEGAVKDLRSRVEILTSENALVAEESAALRKEVERATVELEGREAEARAFAASLREAQDKCRELEAEAGARREACEALEKRHVSRGGELATARGQIGELKEGLSSLHQQNEALREDVEEKTRTIAELARRVETDGDELWGKVQEASSRARELQEALAARTREGDAATEKARRDLRELETARADNAGMLRVMSGMEKQLAAYAAREATVAQAARDAKEKSENALLARDKAAAREAQVKRELEAERAARRADAQRFLDEKERDVKALAEKFAARLRDRDVDLKKSVERAATATARADRAKREADQAHRARAAVRAELDGLEARVAELVAPQEKKRLDAEIQVAKLLRDRKKKPDASASSSSSSSTRRHQQLESSELEEDLRAATADAAAAQAKVGDLAETLASREKDVARLHKTLDDERAEAAKRLADTQRDADAERRRLSEALGAARKANDEARSAHSRQAERHRANLAKLANERQLADQQAAARLEEEEGIVAKLSAYDRDLEIRLASASADLEAQLATNAKLREKATIAERRAADLSAQLARSLREQDLLLKRASAARPPPAPNNRWTQPAIEPTTTTATEGEVY